jgi:hypothetical protein
MANGDPVPSKPIEVNEAQEAAEGANELVDDFGGHDAYSEGVLEAMRAEGGMP